MRRYIALLVVGLGLLSLLLADGCSNNNLTGLKEVAKPSPYELVQAWGGSGGANGQFMFPRGVAVDRAGRVYVADAGNYRIQVFSTAGTYLSQWGDSGSANGQFNYPVNLAVDASGDVYVADINNFRIQKFSSEGAYLTQWGTRGSGNGQFEGPWGVATDARGNVYVADPNNRRVEKFSSTGVYLTQWAAGGDAASCDVPQGVAVDDSGNVFVVISNDDCGGHPCVQKFTGDGVFLTQWGTIGRGKGQFFDPDGIAVDGRGNVFVTDTENWRIQKFTRMGSYQTEWISGAEPNGYCAPGGIAVDGLDYVYVAEWNFCNRIQKFAPNTVPLVSSAKIWAAPASQAFHIVCAKQSLSAGERMEVRLEPAPPAGTYIDWRNAEPLSMSPISKDANRAAYTAPLVISPGAPPASIRVDVSGRETGRIGFEGPIALVPGAIAGSDDCLAPGQAYSPDHAAIEPNGTAILRVEGLVVHMSDPEYPPDAASRGLTDTVPIQVLLCTSGRVLAAYPLIAYSASGEPVEHNPELTNAAVTIASSRTFAPLTQDGATVAGWIHVHVGFQP